MMMTTMMLPTERSFARYVSVVVVSNTMWGWYRGVSIVEWSNDSSSYRYCWWLTTTWPCVCVCRWCELLLWMDGWMWCCMYYIDLMQYSIYNKHKRTTVSSIRNTPENVTRHTGIVISRLSWVPVRDEPEASRTPDIRKYDSTRSFSSRKTGFKKEIRLCGFRSSQVVVVVVVVVVVILNNLHCYNIHLYLYLTHTDTYIYTSINIRTISSW